jgi:hypothetical protein
MVERGASWDYEEYQPHVTITYNGGGIDLHAIEPYRGRLVFGPEIFEEINENWGGGPGCHPPFLGDTRRRHGGGQGATRSHFDPTQPRGGDGRWVSVGWSSVLAAARRGDRRVQRHSWGEAQDADRIAQLTGFDVHGYQRVMRSSEVRHVLQQHGDPVRETARGQVAINRRDIKRIPEIVRQAHDVKGVGKLSARKPPRIVYTARVGRFEYTYTETVHTSAQEVALKSLYKRRM